MKKTNNVADRNELIDRMINTAQQQAKELATTLRLLSGNLRLEELVTKRGVQKLDTTQRVLTEAVLDLNAILEDVR